MRDAIQGQQDTLPFHLQDGQILPSLAWPMYLNLNDLLKLYVMADPGSHAGPPGVE